MNVVTLDEARYLGLTRYYTGIACKRGHDAERLVANKTCTLCISERKKAYYKTEAGKSAACRQHHSYRSSDPERAKEQDKRNYSGRKNEVKALTANRRAAKDRRTPVWSDVGAIKRFYKAAPPGMAVDHVVPLRGELVSGLHVPNNLQYLSGPENSRKINKWDPWHDSAKFDKEHGL